MNISESIKPLVRECQARIRPTMSNAQVKHELMVMALDVYELACNQSHLEFSKILEEHFHTK